MLAAREDHAYLFLSLLQARVGGSLMRRLPGGDARNLLGVPASEIARELGLGEKASRTLVELAEGFDAAVVIDRLGQKGFRAITYAEEAYPARLRLAPDPPPALFVGGGWGRAYPWPWWGPAGRPGRGWRRPGRWGARSPRGGRAW